MFEVDYSLLAPEYGVMQVDAVDADDAEAKALHKLTTDLPDAKDITIEMVKEIN